VVWFPNWRNSYWTNRLNIFTWRLFGICEFSISTPSAVTPGTTYYLQPVIQSGDSFEVGVVSASSYANGTAFFHGVAVGSNLWFREGIVVPEPSVVLLGLTGTVALFFLPTEKPIIKRETYDQENHHSHILCLDGQFTGANRDNRKSVCGSIPIRNILFDVGRWWATIAF
jgi:hypothetical protein